MGKKSIGAMPTPPKPPNPTDTTFAEECASLGMQEFDEEFNRRLREKLDALEEVRSDLSNEGIKVPGIVVCGAQSAGKSSVMEYLSDLNFPRAENTCTRCPTIVSLATDPQTTSPYALIGLEADKSKRTRLDDLSLFGTKIEELTDQLTSKVGTGAGVITNVPIYVTVVRQKGPTLTLIDIPGITHLCTDGEQEDIHAVTKDLVESYIKDDAMVILVVIPATDDFGNAEALKLAKQYDPQGTRTLGVVTKIDLLTTDSYDSLVKRITMQGKNIHLQLGFIGLRCRTPAEVKAGITRAEAMIAEEKLRNSHPLLAQLDSTQFGLRALVSRIVDVQAERVDASFPEIKKLLVSRLEEAEADLARLKPACDDDTQRLQRMDEMVRTLDRDLCDAISGALDCSRDDTTLPLPATWCKLSLEFEGAIRKATPDFFSDEYKEKLQNQLKRVQGASLPNFMSSPVFVKSHTDIFFSKATTTHKADGTLMDESKHLLSGMQMAMRDVFDVLVNRHFEAFPKLKDVVQERCEALLSLQSKHFMQHVQTLLKAEATKPFTFNSKFMDTVAKLREILSSDDPSRSADVLGFTGTSRAISTKADVQGVPKDFINNASSAISTMETNERIMTIAVAEMQISLFCYSELMFQVIFDTVPKLLWSDVVNELGNVIAQFVKEPFSDKETLTKLMAEDPREMQLRTRKQLTVKRLQDSLEVFRRVA